MYLGGGGKDPIPTGPAHKVNPMEHMEGVVEEELILSSRTTWKYKFQVIIYLFILTKSTFF